MIKTEVSTEVKSGFKKLLESRKPFSKNISFDYGGREIKIGEQGDYFFDLDILWHKKCW